MAQHSQHDEDAAFEPLRLSTESQAAEQTELSHNIRSFGRQNTWTSPSTRYHNVSLDDQDGYEVDIGEERADTHGLGLSGIPEQVPRIKRVPVGSKDTLSTERSFLDLNKTPGISSTPFSQSETARNTPEQRSGNPHTVKFATPQSSFVSVKEPAYEHTEDDVSLIDHNHGHNHDHEPNGNCPTQGDILSSDWSWFSTTIVFLAIYSTLFSGIFLGISFAKPRWGERIGTRGHLSFSTASLLSALFSKTIELSFVTVFVATLGQILSRKAFTMSRAKGGISIAEMNMRLWIMQPGTLITNWIGVRYAATTILGALALVAAASAVFYTTAAEALVAPKLKFGRNETHLIMGKVAASYANAPYLADKCATPIPLNSDADRGTTCLQIEHAGQGYHNLNTWLTSWALRIDQGDNIATNTSFGGRPPPVANLYDNTTVYGQWITPSGENITADSSKYGRLVQNVTMAMPHANVFHAVRDPINHILQPDDLQGAGEYYMKASVPAPAMNVLCVGMSTEEAKSFIRVTKDTGPPEWPIKTPFDKMFGWTQNPAVEGGEQAPIFPLLPIPYNTVTNTSDNIWGPAAVYLLATPPSSITTNDHVLCSFKSMQYPNCTTAYHVAQSGGQLTVHCDGDPENTLPYSKYNKNAPLGLWEQNWKDVGSEWIRSVALPSGMMNSNASTARLMTQMIPLFNSQYNSSKLDPGTPSMGEALSILAGCTLLLSSDSSPFMHYWNYSGTVSYLESPQYQSFPAEISFKDFASGGSQQWQGIFYPVLLAVFCMNCFCLVYLVWNFSHYGQVTDYTEPQNLFALAINSPPSNILAGACGAGPSGKMLSRKWCVDMSTHTGGSNPNSASPSPYQGGGRRPMASQHPHFYVRSTTDEPMGRSSSVHHTPAQIYQGSSPNHDLTPKEPDTGVYAMGSTTPPTSTKQNDIESPGVDGISYVSSMKRRPKHHLTKTRSVQDFSIDESPAVVQYMKLAGR